MPKAEKHSQPSAVERLDVRLRNIERMVDRILDIVTPPDPDTAEADAAIDDMMDSIGRADR